MSNDLKGHHHVSMTTELAPDFAPVSPSRGTLSPLGVAHVKLLPGFWGDRQALASETMIGHAAGWMRKLGWVKNLENAAAGGRFEHQGREFADSEIYKLIEAISWDVLRGESAHLDLLDELVKTVIAAQDPDGYLHTLLGRPWQRPRYSDFSWGHELYCFGHFIQASIAHYGATGSEELLNAARRLADHVVTMFGENGLNKVCGHAGIELGLAELSRITGDPRYIKQAAVFIERRGTGTLPLHEFGRAYWQDDVPVREAVVLRGHAVRALYLAAGATDVAVETGDDGLLSALMEQWDRTVARRTYITGGMGSHHMDEAFGEDFVLPPDRSYCETCAGVASMMFSWRLLLASGKAKYADLIERTLYNIVATSPSRNGQAFFYANTLHQRHDHGEAALNDDGVVVRGGAAGREAWFEVSCCPPNVARTLTSLGAYIATENERGVQLHQFMSAHVETSSMVLDIETQYPHKGIVQIRATQVAAGATLSIRIPQWAGNAATVQIDDSSAVAVNPGGYADVPLTESDHLVTLSLPVQTRLIQPDDRIDACRGTVAFERGPEVLALESADLPEGWSLEDVVLVGSSCYEDECGEVRVDLARVTRDKPAPWAYAAPSSPPALLETATVALIPYHDWAERGPSTMRIWIPKAP